MLNQETSDEIETCSWKQGTFHEKDFYLNACAWCYLYLFPVNGLFPQYGQYLISVSNNSRFSQGTLLLADAQNVTAREKVCKSLSGDECELWGYCCDAGRECCKRQISAKSDVKNMTSCGITWDGYSCWNIGTPGERSYQSCPSYLQFSMPTRE